MVIVKATPSSEAGAMPTEEHFRAMGAFAEEMVQAGVLLVGDGLHPSSKGKRVRRGARETKVIDGPFAETKELVAGYWVWQVATMDEAVAWARRYPIFAPYEDVELELRPMLSAEDFDEKELTPELQAEVANRRAVVAERGAAKS